MKQNAWKGFILSLFFISATSWSKDYLLSSSETPSEIKELALELLNSLEVESWVNPADGEYTAVIGRPYPKWYSFEGGHHVVRLEYKGCGSETGNVTKSFYLTEADAIDDSCDPEADVSWSWELYYDGATKVLDSGLSWDSWDWSGH